MKDNLYSKRNQLWKTAALALLLWSAQPFRLLAQNLLAQDALYRINAGGPALSTSLGEFAADSYYSPVPDRNSGLYTGTFTITDTPDPTLYVSEHFGTCRYAFPVPNGQYKVVLHFAENIWTQPGKRVFNVFAEGQNVLPDYDIFQRAGGIHKAKTETLLITVSDAELTLDFVSRIDPAKICALEVYNNNIAAWGDSFTEGANQQTPYPALLAPLSGRNVFNGGRGGQTSVQIKNRMLADTQKHGWPTIIWAGRNDSDKPEQVKASIAAIVAALPHQNYLVLAVCNGAEEGIRADRTPTYGYYVQTNLNKQLAAVYGNHFLDVRAYLRTQYNPNDPQDVADFAADIPPTSLRSDGLHPNTTGNNVIANYIYEHARGASSPLATTSRAASSARVQVYPNPAQQTTQVLVSGATSGKATLQLYDMAGKLLLSAPVSGAAPYQLDLLNLPRGLYLLRYTSASFSQTIRLAKE